MDKVIKELRCVSVYDAMSYQLERRYTNCIVDDTYKLGGMIAFYVGSWADNHMDLNYWKRVDYAYLPKKSRGTHIVWYKFIGKHARVKY